MTSSPSSARRTSLDDIAAALVRELALPYRVAGREQRISASIGVYSGHPVTTGDALQSADIALYAAKEAGRNRAVRYHPALREAHVAHTVLADQLRAAVEAGVGFAMHYHSRWSTCRPAGSRRSRRCCGSPRPTASRVSPAVFVPVAEETGLIGKLGSWVLEQSCADAKAWHDEHGISVTVTSPAASCANPHFADEVLAVLKRTGLPGAALVLEITETVRGHRVAGGDGRGERRLPACARSASASPSTTSAPGTPRWPTCAPCRWTCSRSTEPSCHRIEERQDQALFRAVVELARSMYLTPVAEGVETPGQAAVLRSLDCALAQGFLFARPMPAPALAEFLQQEQGRRRRLGAAVLLLGPAAGSWSAAPSRPAGRVAQLAQPLHHLGVVVDDDLDRRLAGHPAQLLGLEVAGRPPLVRRPA
ncbi:hypothetical protein GCM10020218_059680 [Dactylosporangium vinaceum]